MRIDDVKVGEDYKLNSNYYYVSPSPRVRVDKIAWVEKSKFDTGPTKSRRILVSYVDAKTGEKLDRPGIRVTGRSLAGPWAAFAEKEAAKREVNKARRDLHDRLAEALDDVHLQADIQTPTTWRNNEGFRVTLDMDPDQVEKLIKLLDFIPPNMRKERTDG